MSSGEETIRVLIVDDIAETRENLKKMLYFESDIEVVGTAASGEEGIELAKEYQPHVVLMDINMPGLDGISASEAITREVPFAQVVMMSVQSEADYLRRSMLAGARDFLTKPFTMDELLSTIRRVYAMAAHTRSAMPSPQTTAPQLAPSMPEKTGKVIVLYSPKGGVGCTVLAINLATAMCQIDREAQVAVVDCSLQFGDVTVALDIRADRSIVDLAGVADDLDTEMIESAMVEDNRSGLKVLLAPAKPEMAELVTAEHVRAILDRMKSMFDYVIVDTGSRLQDTELSAFDLADRLILIIVPTLPSIANARYFFEVLAALEYPPEKILLVLNQSDPRTGLNAHMIENSLKHPVFAEIPFEDRLVLQSVNHGIPYMLIPNVDKRSSLVQKTRALAQSVMQGFAEKEAEDDSGPAERPLGRLFH